MFNKIYDRFKNYIKENYRFLISVVLIIVFVFYDTGYGIYKPGGTINESERITGENLYSSKGSFNMAYVGFMEGKLPFYLLSLVLPSWEAYKEEDLVLTDEEDFNDTLIRDKLEYDNAISVAKKVAFDKSGIEYEIKNTHYYVTFLTKDNTSGLKIGDEILAYDNIELTDFDAFKDYIQTKDEGSSISLKYQNNDTMYYTNAVVYMEDDTKLVGIGFSEINDYDTKYNLNVNTKESESGPSGGLIMTLSIYNSLIKEDITRGLKIVGTGTINSDGSVGAIGSVKYKLSSAVKDKADVFICPNENYDEAFNYAKDMKYDIILIGVDSFDDTLEKLNNLEAKK